MEINEKNNRAWKELDKRYLEELQKFFDKVDNVDDLRLKSGIIHQMLRCDKILTEIAEEMFKVVYIKGYNEAKKG